MTTNRTDISNKFNNGMIPSEGDFDEIFDSFVHKDDKADLQMIEAGTDDQHYVTPALLNTGLQNLGIITGNCYMPYKEHIDGFSGTVLRLNKTPIEYSIKLFKNGQLLLEGEDYTVNYNTAVITFSSEVIERNIEIDYWYKNLGPVPGSTDITAPKLQGLQDVVDTDPFIDTVQLAMKSGGSFSVIPGNGAWASGQLVIGTNLEPVPNDEFAVIGLVKSAANKDLKLGFQSDRAEFMDTLNNRGLEYAGDYESNFIARSLVTKQYVDSITNSYLNKGTILIGDVNAHSVNYSYSTTGDINTAVLTTTTSNGEIITVTIDNPYPDLNYEVIINVESLGNMENDNDMHPVIWKKISAGSFFIYLEETGNATQNIKLHVKTRAL